MAVSLVTFFFITFLLLPTKRVKRVRPSATELVYVRDVEGLSRWSFQPP